MNEPTEREAKRSYVKEGTKSGKADRAETFGKLKGKSNADVNPIFDYLMIEL